MSLPLHQQEDDHPAPESPVLGDNLVVAMGEYLARIDNHTLCGIARAVLSALPEKPATQDQTSTIRAMLMTVRESADDFANFLMASRGDAAEQMDFIMSGQHDCARLLQSVAYGVVLGALLAEKGQIQLPKATEPIVPNVVH